MALIIIIIIFDFQMVVIDYRLYIWYRLYLPHYVPLLSPSPHYCYIHTYIYRDCVLIYIQLSLPSLPWFLLGIWYERGEWSYGWYRNWFYIPQNMYISYHGVHHYHCHAIIMWSHGRHGLCVNIYIFPIIVMFDLSRSYKYQSYL